MARTAQGLTDKQEAFARAYIETSNASEAYRRAYDASNTKEEVVWVKACEMLKNGKVRVRVDELRAELAAMNEITVERLTKMTLAAYDRAMKEGVDQSSAAVKAAEFLGKLHGLVVDKKHVTSDNRHHHSAEPLSPFSEFLAEALGSGTEGKAEGPLQN